MFADCSKTRSLFYVVHFVPVANNIVSLFLVIISIALAVMGLKETFLRVLKGVAHLIGHLGLRPSREMMKRWRAWLMFSLFSAVGLGQLFTMTKWCASDSGIVGAILLGFVVFSVGYWVYLWFEIAGTENADYSRLEYTLLLRCLPWFVYSLAVSALVGLSIETVRLNEDGPVYVVFLASTAVCYLILANLTCGINDGLELPGVGLDSAAETLDDLLDSTQLLLILVDKNSTDIPGILQGCIIAFSCLNFVVPTLLLGNLVPFIASWEYAWGIVCRRPLCERLRRWLQRNRKTFGAEIYTVVDKVCVDIPRVVIRLILLKFYKNAVDEDILEMFICKTFMTLMVVILSLASKFSSMKPEKRVLLRDEHQKNE